MPPSGHGQAADKVAAKRAFKVDESFAAPAGHQLGAGFFEFVAVDIGSWIKVILLRPEDLDCLAFGVESFIPANGCGHFGRNRLPALKLIHQSVAIKCAEICDHPPTGRVGLRSSRP